MNKVRFLLFALTATLVLNACKRDEKQILGSWLVSKVTIGGADKTADYTKNGYKESYGESGVYSFSGDPANASGEGDYQWTEKNKIKRSGVSSQPSMEITVTTLTRKKFVYTATISGESATFEFQKMR
jgi:hypothetical protein